eukprot:TRINITY_DN5578_c1_g1_i3.p1 TRINITY_DN5578_c1_g1~~TRINITY_DN5578_c1_g1_i3.p1  ORF type:complete len:235 (-),score=28.47 TRINITY_DN5578_c1_g1_i3:1256-1861(-)
MAFQRPVHPDVSCDGCGASPITGIRYKCSQCANFDICESCLLRLEAGEGRHGAPGEEHLFLRVAKPQLSGNRTDLMNRASSVHKVACSGCSASSIIGFRYSCQICLNVHLCESCEALGTKHDPKHPRLKALADASQSAFPTSSPGTAESVANPFASDPKSKRNSPLLDPGMADMASVAFGMLHRTSGRDGQFTAFGDHSPN